MSATLKPPPSRMTVAEFVQWPEDPTGARWQLVDGEPVLMAPASDAHNTIQNNIQFMLEAHLRASGSSCRVVPSAGIRPRVRPDHNVRIPDVAVTCTPLRHSVHLTPDPVLAVEILSVGNEAQTWSNVYTYCTIPSLLEILVVRSAAYSAELLRRAPSGDWPERFTPVGEAFDLASVAGTFSLAAIYRKVPSFDSP